jgi:hypothetical protein
VSEASRDLLSGGKKSEGSFAIWANERTVPGARLVAFESWLYAEMSQRLIWPKEAALRAKMIGQCRAFTMEAVADLERHGFLFQPRDLAALLREKLDAIGKLQEAGKIESLYPYFRTCWRGWVRREAENLRDRSMACGSHIQQIMQRVLVPGRASAAASMPEIVSQSLREQAAAARRAGNRSRTSEPELFTH